MHSGDAFSLSLTPHCNGPHALHDVCGSSPERRKFPEVWTAVIALSPLGVSLARPGKFHPLDLHLPQPTPWLFTFYRGAYSAAVCPIRIQARASTASTLLHGASILYVEALCTLVSGTCYADGFANLIYYLYYCVFRQERY